MGKDDDAKTCPGKAKRKFCINAGGEEALIADTGEG
jgi:hypothetical protein